MEALQTDRPSTGSPRSASFLGSFVDDSLPSEYTVHGTWMDWSFDEGLVSVIVPTYNRAHFLPDAIRSVYAQTHRPIELIVVDDGSTDHTESIVESLGAEAGSNVRFRYLQQSNRGAPVARNRGLIESRGEFIQFLDSDDILHPQKLEIQTQILRIHSELDHTWADFHLEPETDFNPFSLDSRREYSVCEAVGSIDRRSRTPAEVWSGLYRRSLCVRIGPWNETLGRWQDVEYNFRVDARSPKTAYVEPKLYKMRDHSKGRILDARYESEGLDKGFHTLDVIKTNKQRLAAASPSDLEVPEFNLGGFYFKLVQLALRMGCREKTERAFREAIAHTTSVKRKRALQLLKGVYWLFGPHLASSLFTTYSKLRGGR